MEHSVDHLALLSLALDEIHRLRRALAYEAQVLHEHTRFASFPKSRREIAEQQVERMRDGVLRSGPAYSGMHTAAMHASAAECGYRGVTVDTWKKECGL